MLRNILLKVVTAVVIYGAMPSSFVVAAPAKMPILKVTPSQCVALTHGQKCYIEAQLKWQTPTKGNYCLFSSQQKEPLFCWIKQNQGQYSQEFASNKNIEFSLRLEAAQDNTASNQLKVTWVHQKQGKPRMWWRLF